MIVIYLICDLDRDLSDLCDLIVIYLSDLCDLIVIHLSDLCDLIVIYLICVI